ncbi:unnamed protein product [Effrenium voratum]|nr:unnamed protein product [Effrenium voratum]
MPKKTRWRSWPILWSIITGKKAAWPGSPCRNFLELFVPSHFKEKDQVVPWMRMQARAAEQVPTVPAGSRAAGQREGERAPELPNLREAAHMVLALRKEQGAETRQLDDPAEPCMAALFQLVEDIVYGVPKDLSERILQNADGEIAKLYNLFVDLNRLPQRQDRKRRVRRLLAAMRYVEQLSSLCQYMGPFTRLSFDELHAQILVELWLARSMALQPSGQQTLQTRLLGQRGARVRQSQHESSSALAAAFLSRCQLLEAQLPTAPRLWLVHWQTLQGLGRLPKAREFQHLTLATAAHQAHGSKAVVLLAVHRWRSANSVDPQNVTWRQLVTFARWYRSRWGQELEVYFWIDSCCVPELRARLPEQEAETKEDIWVTDDEAAVRTLVHRLARVAGVTTAHRCPNDARVATMAARS